MGGGEVTRRRPMWEREQSTYQQEGRNKVSHYVLLVLCIHRVKFPLFPSDVGGNSIYSSFPLAFRKCTLPSPFSISSWIFGKDDVGCCIGDACFPRIEAHAHSRTLPPPFPTYYKHPQETSKGMCIGGGGGGGKGRFGKGRGRGAFPRLVAGQGSEVAHEEGILIRPLSPLSILIAVCCYIHMGLDGMGLLQSGIGTYVQAYHARRIP